MASIDIYEMRYRDIQLSGNIRTDEPEMNFNTYMEMSITCDTDKEVHKVVNEINYTNAEETTEIVFSEAVYTIFPRVNKENNQISINEYTPIFIEENKNKEPKEYIERYKSFDTEKLPLIEVAKLIDVKVEKSNQIKEYGKYRYKDKKILLGSDNPLTFLHELAHAIVDLIDDDIEDTNISEQVAELSAIAMAKYYKIPCTISHTASYLKRFPVSDSDKEEVYKRVKKILEFVKQAKDFISH